MTFGETIKKHREAKGLFLRQAAAFLEVDTAFISKIENSERKASREQVMKLAEFLGTPAQELLTVWLADKTSAHRIKALAHRIKASAHRIKA